MRIVFYPDPVLRKRALDVDPRREGLRDLVDEMLRTMKEASGVGLAAPQVGQSVRVFVASDTGEIDDAMVCLNPKLEPFGPVVPMEEGCLSVPGVRREIRRSESVRLKWTDLDGAPQEGEFHGLLARIIQHECDHLDGILFFERMNEADRLSIRDDLRGLEEQYRP
ncbi:MAG TPA: peptide deformylase [Planctomycetota bacterium]|nr:peptide deformylase [Planctomycetota bacterium]